MDPPRRPGLGPPGLPEDQQVQYQIKGEAALSDVIETLGLHLPPEEPGPVPTPSLAGPHPHSHSCWCFPGPVLSARPLWRAHAAEGRCLPDQCDTPTTLKILPD